MPFQVTITGGMIRRLIWSLLILALLGLAAYGLVTLVETDPFGGRVNEARYQAVFLSNDRVYFGRLRPAGREFYELRDAYFIQQATAGEGEEQKPTQQVKPISEELQGPERNMLIPRRQVVVVENLRKDSAVAAAIDRVKKASK